MVVLAEHIAERMAVLPRRTAGTVVHWLNAWRGRGSCWPHTRMAGTMVLSFCRCSSRPTFVTAVPMKCFPEAETEPVVGRKIDGIAEVITTSKSSITQLTAEGPEVERLAHERMGRVEQKQAKRLRDQAHAKG